MAITHDHDFTYMMMMMMMMMITDEFGRMIKKPVMCYFKILIKHFAVGTVENHTKP
jgi:hypothetical protein